MKILVIGGGGREHAVVWKLSQEKGNVLYCAPGNAGIAELATLVPIKATDVLALTDYAQRETFDLVCVTPDDPLALGLVDLLTQKGIPAFGPVAAAAQIEASKAFCKNLLAKYGIPTAAFAVFDDAAIAKEYLASQPVPVVVKADGLALGKGVFICQTRTEAENAIDEIMVRKAFGASGLRVVIEEFITGPEVSLLFFCDGTHVVPMPAAQDHKRVYDGDRGPNTGGMGAFAPTPMLTKPLYDEVLKNIIMPTVSAMKAEGREFRGILYCGLMLTPNGPRVLEYNARFGDPETQAILPLMETPLSTAMFACMNGTLDQTDIRFSDGACVCIAAASGGYPGQYERGFEIAGLDCAQARGAQVFHAGTAARDGGFVTDGGRVLGVVQCAPTLGEAIKKAYEAVGEISFEGMHFRRDIGVK